MPQMQLQYSFAECCKPVCLHSELHVMGIGAKQIGLNEKKKKRCLSACGYLCVCTPNVKVALFPILFCYDCNLNMRQNIAIFFPSTSIAPPYFTILKRHFTRVV